MTPIENLASLPQYDKEKYKEMTFDAVETVLGFLALIWNKGRKKWCEELKEQRVRDIETEMI